MQINLTLSVEQEVIHLANQYADQQGLSLSSLVEKYLRTISTLEGPSKSYILDPIVKELWGSVANLPNQKNDSELLADALLDKYLK
jgi:hypothetical protein